MEQENQLLTSDDQQKFEIVINDNAPTVQETINELEALATVFESKTIDHGVNALTLRNASFLIRMYQNIGPEYDYEIKRLQAERDEVVSKLEILTDRVRNATDEEDLNGLHRLIGPTEEENNEASARLKRIDDLDTRCEWDSMTPSWQAQQYREHRQRIMDIQIVFENKYL